MSVLSRSPLLIAAAAAALGLAACGTSTGSAGTAASSPAASSSTGASEAPTTVAVATTSLGPTVVDSEGRTLYMFAKDTAGASSSACSGACAGIWPAYVDDGAVSKGGVTGTLATIATADGHHQVTLNGWPLYHFAKDAAAGDVRGQGVNDVWFVLDASGQPVRSVAPAASTSGGKPGY